LQHHKRAPQPAAKHSYGVHEIGAQSTAGLIRVSDVNDASRCSRLRKHQAPKIAVLCQENPLALTRKFKNPFIRCATCDFGYCQHVVTRGSKGSYTGEIKALVSDEVQLSLPASSRRG